MRLRPAVAATAAALAAVLGMPPPAAFAADPATVLYVAGKSASCSDSGQGGQAAPFCTIAAAAAVVLPGQTVRIAPGSYPEQVDVRRSGTPGHPIRFVGDWTAGWTNTTPRVSVMGSHWPSDQPLTHAFTLTGVHDVELRELYLESKEEAVTVTDSSAVTLDRLYVQGKWGAQTGGVSVSGASSDVTVSRNQVLHGNGVTIGAGVLRAVVTTNDIGNSRTGIAVTDAPGTVVTGNTVTGSEDSGIVLAGASTGAVVENNVLVRNAAAGHPGTAQLDVGAGSVTGTKADYNLVADEGDGGYRWAGTAYRLPAFRAATGQGAHDTAETGNTIGGPVPSLPREGSPAIDSGDPSAPGLPDTDQSGRPVIDDPKVPNAPGGGVRDRGAYERYGMDYVSLFTDVSQGPYPLTVKANASVRNDWTSDQPTTYTFDFGDGSAPVTSTEGTVPHTYTAKGEHQVTVTATDGFGQRLTTLGDAYGAYGATVSVRDPAPVKAALWPTNPAGDFRFDLLAGQSSSPWPITSYAFDFGDGSPVQTNTYSSASHLYAAPGTYTASLTVTDSAGRTDRTTAKVTPGFAPAGFVPVAPKRVYDTRDPANDPGASGNQPFRPGERREIKAGIPAGATAAVVNITATGATTATHLDTSTIGGAGGQTSSINIGPGETVANLVTVPITSSGDTRNLGLKNHDGTVHVVIDLYGYYLPQSVDGYAPTPATRIADTRQSGAKLGPGASLPLKVAGSAGVPSGAKAVALNLTATEPTAAGFLAVRPGGQSGRPATSSLNFAPGRTVANQVIVPLGPDGTVEVYNNDGSTHVIADVIGYYGADAKGRFTAVVPVRLQDTRNAPYQALNPGAETTVGIGGTGQVPANAVAGVVNLTAVAPRADGHVIAYPDLGPVPTTSNLNFRAGQTVANHAQVPLGTNGAIRLRNNSGGALDLITDLYGYFTTG
ncbi:PKD domain-containing protein [Kitasatospora sp. NPDC091335]|uniref:PKD domain-containing protein n=1 Tax=Kitasatospora sp. NPDC091335 TaxID=3364085 RepID=UPI0037F3BB88